MHSSSKQVVDNRNVATGTKGKQSSRRMLLPMSPGLNSHQGFVLFGRRPGRRTVEPVDRAFTRRALAWGVCIAGLCLLPQAPVGAENFPAYAGGASLLIVAIGGLDLLTRAQSQLAALRPRPSAPSTVATALQPGRHS